MKHTLKKVFALAAILSILLNLGGCKALDKKYTANMQKPKVEYGEFPFELVCEIDGEEVTFKDTFIIEYKGATWDLNTGASNQWHTEFLNSSVKTIKYSKDILLKEGIDEIGSYSIEFFLGTCEYYMGLSEVTRNYTRFNIYPGDITFTNPYYTGPATEEILEKYNIKIIKKSISAPLTDNVKN